MYIANMGQLLSTSKPASEWLMFIIKEGRLFPCVDEIEKTVGGAPGNDTDFLGIDNGGTLGSKVAPELIKKLATKFSEILQTSPPPNNASPKELVQWMQKTLPNPADGRTVTADGSKQKQLCRGLGEILNNLYPNANIDLNLQDKNICSQISEVIGTMGSGIYADFIKVATGVQRTIDNIKVVGEFIKQSKTRINQIANSADKNVAAELLAVTRICDLIMAEHDRQLVILSQLTNTTVKPVTRDLINLLKKNEDFKGLVNSLDAAMGTSEWGDKIAYALAEVPTLADIMDRASSAAKTLGIAISDAMNAKDKNDLALKIEEAKRKSGSSLTASALEEMEDAGQALKKAYKLRSQLTPKLISGANEPDALGANEPDALGGAVGGLPTLEKRVEKQTMTRKAILRSFTEKANIVFEQMLTAVFNMSKKLGTQIPLSDDLSRFVFNLDQIETVYSEGIEYALTGYNQHASATEQRDRFIGKLDAVLSSITPLLNGPAADYFNAIKTPIEELRRHIDFYTDRFNVGDSGKIQKRYVTGKNEDDNDVEGGEANEMVNRARGASKLAQTTLQRVANAANNAANAIQEFEQSADDVITNAKGITKGGAESSRAALTLKNVTRTLKHFYAVAKMRFNLTKVSQEAKEYNKKYDTVLGEAMSKHIDKCKEDFMNFKNCLENTNDNSGCRYNGLRINLLMKSMSAAHSRGKLKEWHKDVVLKMKKNIVDAKIELYRAIQAIDICLMKFSDAAAANPDDIKEVAKLLDSVEIVSEWFNERSGDSVAALFEYMPFMLRRLQPVDSPLSQKNSEAQMVDTKEGRLVKGDSKHYYELVSTIESKDYYSPANKHDGSQGGHPGNPFIVISPQRALWAQSFAKKTVDRILALKNIVSAFAYLGSKFGDTDINAESFMTPGQIYKALCTYLYTSAFVMGWDGYDDTNNDARTLSKPYNSFRDHNSPAPAVVQYNGGGGLAHHSPGNIHGGDNAADVMHTNISGVAAGATDRNHLAVNVGIVSFKYDTVLNDANAEIDTAPANYEDHTGGRAGLAANRDWHALGLNAWPWLNPYMSNDENLKDALPLAKAAFGCAMNSVKQQLDTAGLRQFKTVGGWHNEFEETDRLFILAIKSMVAKVFTVSGLYNMFNYKSRSDHTMSSARFVLGGAAGGLATPSSSLGPTNVPEIYNDAVELYIRLPLLAEFYKDVFSLDEAIADNTSNKSDYLISLIPEMDQMWAGLMRRVFDQPRGSAGVVTKNYASNVINEVNKIYDKYKGKPNLVMSVVNDFIADVNSRFGIMTRNEIDKYTSDELRKRSNLTYSTSGDLRDFDTLGEDLEDMGSGVAPSDRFGKQPYESTNFSTNEFSMAFIKAISDFRQKIDKKVRNAVYGKEFSKTELLGRIHGIPNFHDQVRMTQDSLKAANTPIDRFNMVFSTIAGLDSAVKKASESYVMFHETIIAPLNVLFGVYKILDKFEHTVWHNCIGTAFKLLDKEFSQGGNCLNKWQLDWSTVAAVAANITNLYNFAGAKWEDVIPNKYHAHINGIRTSIRRPDSFVITSDFYNAAGRKLNWMYYATHLQPEANDNDGVTRRGLLFMALWGEKCFKKLVQAIISQASDLNGLVEVNVTGNKLTVDHSRLQQYCEDTMAFIRKSIHLFRGVIDENVLKRYEDISTVGSIAWLQTNLFDDMFYGKSNSGLPLVVKEIADSFLVFLNKDPRDPSKRCFISRLNVNNAGVGGARFNIGGVNQDAVSNVNTTNTLAAPNAAIGHLVRDNDFKGWSVDPVLSELVYYLPYGSRQNGIGSHITVPNMQPAEVGENKVFMFNDQFKHVRTQTDVFGEMYKDMPSSPGGPRLYGNTTFSGRYNFFLQEPRTLRGHGSTSVSVTQLGIGVDNTNSDSCEGLMIKFNEVLARYLEQFWDKSTSKIYKPVIADFANGAANAAVMQYLGYPDLLRLTPMADVSNMVEHSIINSAEAAVNINNYDSINDMTIDRHRAHLIIGNFINDKVFDVPSDYFPDTNNRIQDNWFIAPSWATKFGAILKFGTPAHGTSSSSEFGLMWNHIKHKNIANEIMNKPDNWWNSLGMDRIMINAAGGAGARAIIAGGQIIGVNHQPGDLDISQLYSSVNWAAVGHGPVNPFHTDYTKITLYSNNAANTDVTNTNMLKVWALHACAIVKIRIIKEFGTMEISLSTVERIKKINDVFGSMRQYIKNYHTTRLTTLAMFRTVYNNLPVPGGGPANNAFEMLFREDINIPNDITTLIRTNVDKITDAIMPILNNYLKLILHHTHFSLMRGVMAAMYGLSFEHADLRTLYGGNNAIFSLAGGISAFDGHSSEPHRCFKVIEAYLYMGLTKRQIAVTLTSDTLFINNVGNPAQEAAMQERNDDIIAAMNLTINQLQLAKRILLSQTHDGGDIEGARLNAVGISSMFLMGVTDEAGNQHSAHFDQYVTDLTGNNGAGAIHFNDCVANAKHASVMNFNSAMVINADPAGGNVLNQSALSHGIIPFTQANMPMLSLWIKRTDEVIDTINKRVNDGQFHNVAREMDSNDLERYFGNPEEIVFASLGRIMRIILTEQNRNNIPAYLITTMADVPLRMKENFKACLPQYIKMFAKISQSANILKMVLRHGVKTARDSLYGCVPDDGVKTLEFEVQGRMFGMGYGKNSAPLTDDSNSKEYYNYLLDKISTSCESIIKCATTVLDEVADNPLFMETAENSISSYRNVNNVMPFMPLSSALIGLRNTTANEGTFNTDDTLLPFHQPSDTKFQFLYGTRLILGRPNVRPLLDHTPGMREIAELYNKTAASDKQISLETIGAFLEKYIPLLRWVTDVRTLSGISLGLIWIGIANIFELVPTRVPRPLHADLVSYQLTLSTDALVSLTTSSDKTGAIEKMTSFIGGRDSAGARSISRQDTQVYNIIDLNVNPVNINALRREVPLVNLLNYAYTFDSFARDIIGNFKDSDKMLFLGGHVNNTLPQFLNFVLHPHAPNSMHEDYDQILYNMFGTSVGYNTPGLHGHDVFIINQVLTKSMFYNFETIGNEIRASDSAIMQPPGAPVMNNLKYINPGGNIDNREISTKSIVPRSHGGQPQYQYLRILAQMRFDTTFIRNIMFIATAHRLMRAKMTNELMKIAFPVVSGPAAAAVAITDSSPWQTWEEMRTD